jgi:hypothetical protein
MRVRIFGSNLLPSLHMGRKKASRRKMESGGLAQILAPSLKTGAEHRLQLRFKDFSHGTVASFFRQNCSPPGKDVDKFRSEIVVDNYLKTIEFRSNQAIESSLRAPTQRLNFDRSEWHEKCERLPQPPYTHTYMELRIPPRNGD